jgi:flavin-dependent dehydrogenase
MSCAQTDVAIIGAGPAGCSVAARLRTAGLSVAILTLPPRLGHYRIPEILPPDGIAHWLVSHASLRPHYAMASAWGSDVLSVRHSICHPGGHGWFVDREIFDREILAQAAVPVIHARLTSVEKTHTGWLLHVTGQPALEARVVVDASGRSSVFARQIGVRRIALDRLVSISACAIPVNVPPGEALVESAEAGWWFSALTARGDLSVSWFTTPHCTLFEHALRATVHTAHRISTLLPARLVSRAAGTTRLELPAGEGWLAVGDAAFTSDPLASQGLRRALASAERAAAIIASGSAYESSPLREYRELHKSDVESFVRERRLFYQMERRWDDAPFWKSAHHAPAVF